jgi:primase-polymerase (primpol)-like protein
VRTCEQCGAELAILARRHARFCSPRCRAAAHRAGIPADLRNRDRWVRTSRKKVPLQIDGRAASSTDPATWARYEQVRSSARKGFVLNGDGIACLDLDHCITDGQLDDWARRILDRCPPTYVEISPSGTGLHVWGVGHLDRGRRLRVPGGTVEAYASGRYITVTGKPFEGCPSRLADLTTVLNELLT